MTLALGSSGPAVRILQAALAHANDELLAEDGVFGPATHAAVERFQAAHGLAIDGVVGPLTAAALGLDQPEAPMTSNFPACLAFVLDQEGGFTDDPRDRGGATNHGITLRTLDGYLAGATVEELKNIDADIVAAIYRAEYWDKMACDALPLGVDLMTFDFGVNAGPASSIRILQTACGVDADGVLGRISLAAIGAAPLTELIVRVSAGQRDHYRKLDNFDVFGDGWMARTDRRVRAALAMKGTPA